MSGFNESWFADIEMRSVFNESWYADKRLGVGLMNLGILIRDSEWI